MSLTSHQILVFLFQVASLLLVAVCLGRLSLRLGMPTVVGELLTGVLLGPTLLGHAIPSFTWLQPGDGSQTQLLDALSQIAVLVFVGVSAAHVDLGLVRRRGRTVAAVGGLALVLPMSLGIASAFLLPHTVMGPSGNLTTLALLLGVVMGVSAIPVIAKTLTDLKMVHRDVGQLTLASAAVEDVVAWLMLSIVAAMAAGRWDVRHGYLMVAAPVAFAVVAVLLVRPAVLGGMRLASRSDGSGPMIGTAVAFILGGAMASGLLGLDVVLGAVAVGAVVSTLPRHYRARLAPLRTVTLAVFAPLFLATAGLRMDVTVLRRPAMIAMAAGLLVVAVAGKFVGAYVGGRISGLPPWESVALGAGLNARGAVEVVVASVGLRIGVFSADMYTIVVLIAIMTSLMAPPLLRFAMRRVEQRAEERLRDVELSAWADGPSIDSLHDVSDTH